MKYDSSKDLLTKLVDARALHLKEAKRLREEAIAEEKLAQSYQLVITDLMVGAETEKVSEGSLQVSNTNELPDTNNVADVSFEGLNWSERWKSALNIIQSFSQTREVAELIHRKIGGDVVRISKQLSVRTDTLQKNNILIKLKVNGRSKAFWGLPDWIDNGEIKEVYLPRDLEVRNQYELDVVAKKGYRQSMVWPIPPDFSWSREVRQALYDSEGFISTGAMLEILERRYPFVAEARLIDRERVRKAVAGVLSKGTKNHQILRRLSGKGGVHVYAIDK